MPIDLLLPDKHGVSQAHAMFVSQSQFHREKIFENFEEKQKFILHFISRYAIISELSERHAPLAQLDRASGYGPEGRGFESLTACHPETVAIQRLRGFLLSPHAAKTGGVSNTILTR